MPLDWKPSGAISEAAMVRQPTHGQVVQLMAAVRHPMEVATLQAHLMEGVKAITALIHGQLRPQARLSIRLTLGVLQNQARVEVRVAPGAHPLHRIHGVPLLPLQQTHGGHQLHRTLGARLLLHHQTLGASLPLRHQTVGTRPPLDRQTLGVRHPPLQTLGNHQQLLPLMTHGVPLLHSAAATLGARRLLPRHLHLNPATHGARRLPPLLHLAAITHGALAHLTTLGAARSNRTILGASSQIMRGAARPHLRLPFPASTETRIRGTSSPPLHLAASTHPLLDPSRV